MPHRAHRDGVTKVKGQLESRLSTNAKGNKKSFCDQIGSKRLNKVNVKQQLNRAVSE